MDSLSNSWRQRPQKENSSSSSFSNSLKSSSLHTAGVSWAGEKVEVLTKGLVMMLVLREVVTEGSVVVTAVVDGLGQDIVKLGGGKTSPFCGGSGKVDLYAVPPTCPVPVSTGE